MRPNVLYYICKQRGFIMNIGTLVWQANQGNLRIGTVTGKKLDEKGWAHFSVDWHDDGCHRKATDCYNKTYRVDELAVATVKHLEKVSSAHHLLKDYRPELEIPAC
jgi:hypothetical protein